MRDASFIPDAGASRLNETHDPALRSFVASANRPEADFPIQNLPLAVFRPRRQGGDFRVGVGIGDLILDIGAMADCLAAECGPAVQACRGASMKALMELGPAHWASLRLGLSRLLREESPFRREAEQHLHTIADAEFLLPLKIGNFSDYLASMHHISKVIRVKRPDHPELPQSFVWSPIAYHSRASTVRTSGYGFARPRGQAGRFEHDRPLTDPTRMLDYEVELGIYVGTSNAHGEPLGVDAADAAIFGYSALNDWTARDMQGWESQPLGPFQSKSFTTTVSPWVVTAEALEPYRVAMSRPQGQPMPPACLDSGQNRERGMPDVRMEVLLLTERLVEAGEGPVLLGASRLTDAYWTPGQMVAHHTLNGCVLESGDLIGTGTISGPGDEACGCMFELTRGGRQPFALPNGEARAFVQDGDTVIVRAHCQKPGWPRLGFGEAVATVLPARPEA
ncbi:fumarylacetoacetase [Pigmentiphaga sp. H8]|uniref:fumarylacetoacetase n=1 Tax=Pigmentiphaga sp. H8 TaxID=2488560 RepID=UPI000F5A9F6F|nr:fumarylacetoacetase [Pigmentiphaga sp. H8]AZG08295.1 fumarylacetoacetase [Pigmentiphaga sp. H8]